MLLAGSHHQFLGPLLLVVALTHLLSQRHLVKSDTAAANDDVISSLSFELVDTKRLCFYEDIAYDGTYAFMYKVQSRELFNVNADVESPSGKKVYTGVKRQSDSAQFSALFTGTYMFCFSTQQQQQQPAGTDGVNVTSSIAHRYVYMELRLAEGGATWKRHQRDKDQRVANETEREQIENAMIDEKLTRIHDNAEQVINYQALFRRNEAVGSEAALLLGSHVMWWSLVQAAVIVVTGFGQVLTMKFFFTDRREMTVIAVDFSQHQQHQTILSFGVGQLPIRP